MLNYKKYNLFIIYKYLKKLDKNFPNKEAVDLDPVVQKNIWATISIINDEVLKLTKEEDEFYEKESWGDLLVFLDKFHKIDILAPLIINTILLLKPIEVKNKSSLYKIEIWWKFYFVEYIVEGVLDSVDWIYNSNFWLNIDNIISAIWHENNLIVLSKYL